MMTLVSMFDESGNMLRPWAEAGHTCYAYDILNPKVERVEHFPSGGKIIWRYADLLEQKYIDEIVALNPSLLFGFPPCTDLAGSGAKHFEGKLKRDPLVFVKALELCHTVVTVAKLVGCPWMMENPIGKLSTLWRKPDYIFDPHQYGGYLPEEDVHPRWPQYILPRDAYPKKTCIWMGNGFRKPATKPVDVAPGYSVQFYKLGGKSAKTKKIRSETPRGYAIAVFEENSK